MAFEVLSPGLFACIQDAGRHGYMHQGVTPSGALDRHAYMWALRLLGEQQGNAIEAMAGVELRALADTTVAVTGADLDARLDGKPVEIWRSFPVYQGQILSFPKRRDGLRVYIAVKSGFTVPKLKGSVACTLHEGAGKALRRGDRLAFSPQVMHEYRRVRKEEIPRYDLPLTQLHLLPTYQYEAFSRDAREDFFASVYEVTLQSDRMGYRLQGKAVEGTKEEILSEAIALGSVQIPADGQPIVLLAQRQTIGGYPKIGVLRKDDCFRLAQLIPGAKVQFVLSNLSVCGEQILDTDMTDS